MSVEFRQQTNWCAITGAPSSGKTSVIEELARRGHAVQSEVARELISMDIRNGRSLAEIRDGAHVQDLQRRILRVKLGRERGLNADTLVFMDRGVPDSITYFRLAGLDPAEAVEASKIFRYRAVFILDRLPVVHDAVRTESEQQAKDIEKSLVADYESLGYALVRVPVVPVPQRADIILSALGEKAA